jgi:NitT/TauT family transport system substrate-binding protein
VAPKNIHLLVAGRDAVPNFLRVCIISTAKTLAARGDDAVRFLAAEMNALRFALSHRDETIALTREISQAKPDDPRPAFVFDDAIKYQAVDPTLPLPAEKIQWIQDQMVKAGSMTKVLDLSAVTAPEFRAKALKLVGPNG